MQINPLPPISLLRERFSYDPETGLLTRLKATNSISPKGKSAGYLRKDGYVIVGIGNKQYMAHRIAWALYTGRQPCSGIDHINGNGADNRIANIREATHGENMRNVPVRSTSASGLKGVWAEKSKWVSAITINGKKKYIGQFDTKEEAAMAYAEAANKFHGEFANVRSTANGT